MGASEYQSADYTGKDNPGRDENKNFVLLFTFQNKSFLKNIHTDIPDGSLLKNFIL